MTISTNNGVPAKVAKIEMRAHTDNQMYVTAITNIKFIFRNYSN